MLDYAGIVSMIGWALENPALTGTLVVSLVVIGHFIDTLESNNGANRVGNQLHAIWAQRGGQPAGQAQEISLPSLPVVAA